MERWLHSSYRVFAYFVGLVVLGSCLSDLDHFLPPHQRSWSDNYYFPVIAILGLGLACLGGQIARVLVRHAVLKKKKQAES
jgi:hypothetical protein